MHFPRGYVRYPNRQGPGWGGLRDALGLALALSLPPGVPMRDEMLVAAFEVVAFSVIVQGMTMPVLLRHLLRQQHNLPGR
jgi:NhaP-type Na+/H+ or K+/H+ antiporter